MTRASPFHLFMHYCILNAKLQDTSFFSLRQNGEIQYFLPYTSLKEMFMFYSLVSQVAFVVLATTCALILIGSAILTWKTRFIQIRALPSLISLTYKALFVKSSKQEVVTHSVSPHKALLTAMSTTLGISSIVAPVIAIRLGGPGALLGFLLTAFLGSAATYIEVQLSVRHRTALTATGPMPYLSAFLSPKAAKFYAVCCL
ncbi:MAG: sodium:alanine symporter family protein, partial [Chlamydiae bacterium]|nr:sodium:alanine symporter family protein [Chlamydiota bacterium]